MFQSNLGILSLNVFIASDYVVVTMSVDSFSLKGVRFLKQTLDDVADETEKELSCWNIVNTIQQQNQCIKAIGKIIKFCSCTVGY